MKLMIFDIGGTEIKYSVMDEHLNRWDEGAVLTPDTCMEDFLDTIEALYRPHQGEVSGISVSLPGFIDVEHGVVIGGGAIAYNWGQPVGQLIAQRCVCPVVIGNDGKCAAMAELWKGSLQGCKNASVYLIGTGIGGGLIVNGEIINGSHFTAGEYSFLNIDVNQWEDLDAMMGVRCSTGGLILRYLRLAGLPDDTPMNGREVFRRLHAGDENAQKALEMFCRDNAIQLYNLTVLLDLERIAIGGGISKQPILIETIRREMDWLYTCGPAAVASSGIPKPEIVPCQFSSEANQVGAFYHALRRWGIQAIPQNQDT